MEQGACGERGGVGEGRAVPSLGSASHPVPLVGTAREKICPAREQGQGAKNGQRAGRGTAPARRKRQAGREEKGQPGWWQEEESRASTEQGLSGHRNSPPGRRRVSSWHEGSTERSKIPLSVIRNVLNQ